jgi:hypothetical protein
VNGEGLLPLHAGLTGGHQWLARLLAVGLVGGLWLFAAGVAERWATRQRPEATPMVNERCRVDQLIHGGVLKEVSSKRARDP